MTDPASVYGVLEQAAAALGGVQLVLNAASAYGGERSGPFCGGPIAEADPDAFDSWAAAPARSAFSFLSASGRFALEQGGASPLVQVTGGSAPRAMPGRGLWSAGGVLRCSGRDLRCNRATKAALRERARVDDRGAVALIERGQIT